MVWTRVGLVGAGPWAEQAVVPALAASPDLHLTKAWARRRDRAQQLAGPLGAEVVATPEEAMTGVDAIAFCVPPDVQAALLPAAVASGAALLLEKPVARTVEQAEVLRAATGPVRVHYARLVDENLRPWLEDARSQRGQAWDHAEVVLTNGATLGDDPFGRSPWRRDPLGALWDLGPHALAWLQVVLGPAQYVVAARRGHEILLETMHGPAGLIAETVLSVASPQPQERFVLSSSTHPDESSPPPERQTGAETYAALLASHDLDETSACWRAVADPRFSTAIVRTLAEAARQLEG